MLKRFCRLACFQYVPAASFAVKALEIDKANPFEFKIFRILYYEIPTLIEHPMKIRTPIYIKNRDSQMEIERVQFRG